MAGEVAIGGRQELNVAYWDALRPSRRHVPTAL